MDLWGCLYIFAVESSLMILIFVNYSVFFVSSVSPNSDLISGKSEEMHQDENVQKRPKQITHHIKCKKSRELVYYVGHHKNY